MNYKTQKPLLHYGIKLGLTAAQFAALLRSHTILMGGGR